MISCWYLISWLSAISSYFLMTAGSHGLLVVPSDNSFWRYFMNFFQRLISSAYLEVGPFRSVCLETCQTAIEVVLGPMLFF
jgi:hypothetical protein